MSYYHDIFRISIRGNRDCVIKMLNAAIRNVGSGDIITESDVFETVLHKLKDVDGNHLLRLSIPDLMNDECLQDESIRDKKASFEGKMEYCREVLDGKVPFGSEEEEGYAQFQAAEALENVIDGRFIDITGVDMSDGICEVRMEYYVGEEALSYPDWVDWDDVCRLYDCRVVIDDDEYLNGTFHEFCGTTIYEMKNGLVKKTLVKPELGLREYIDSMDSIVKMDPGRYREKKIKDMETKVRALQDEISHEKLLCALGRLDETGGHLQVPEGVTRLSEIMWEYAEKIRSIYIPASVDVINKHSISSSNIESIEISTDNRIFCSVNNCVLDKGKTTLLIGCKGSVIPEGVIEIEESAFNCCRGLEEVRIPSSVRKIGRHAFDCCSGLTRLVFDEGVQELWPFSFSGCTSLARVSLPESLVDLPDNAFYGCLSLRDVALPQHLRNSCGRAFKSTPFGGGLEEWTDPDRVLPF